MAVTRKEIRRAAIRDLGDILIATATADGTDVSLIDTTNLTGPAQAYLARQILFTGPNDSDNLGEQRYCTQSSAINRSIAWGVALPADTAEGDECELLNTRATGFRFQDVHEQINSCIRSVAKDALFPVQPFTVEFTYGTPIEIPELWSSVEYVRRLDTCDTSTDTWRVIHKSPREHGDGWWIDKATRQINVTGSEGYSYSGATMKVWGLGSHAEVFDDRDPILLDEDWLVSAVQARLARAKHMRQPMTETERVMYGLQQNAAVAHPRVLTSRSAFSVLL